MTDVDADELRTVIHHGPDGTVLALHGYLSRVTAPAVDTLLACLRETERGATTVDLRDVELEPGLTELVARWGVG
jgi:hypothetical protein